MDTTKDAIKAKLIQQIDEALAMFDDKIEYFDEATSKRMDGKAHYDGLTNDRRNKIRFDIKLKVSIYENVANKE